MSDLLKYLRDRSKFLHADDYIFEVRLLWIFFTRRIAVPPPVFALEKSSSQPPPLSENTRVA
jgi:hypothetical protein